VHDADFPQLLNKGKNMGSMFRLLYPLAAMGAGVALAMVLIAAVAARLESPAPAGAPAHAILAAAPAR
jgi:hypothetical protein